MSFHHRKNLISHADNRVLHYAAIFLLCASMSAMGAGPIAVTTAVGVAGAVKLFAGKRPS